MIRTLALIVARGGSKGIPGKNLRQVAGRPLIAHTFAAAAASDLLDRIVLSTDDPSIADLGRTCGVSVPFMRPSEFAGDTSPVIDATLHALSWLADHEDYRPDFVMLLQPTSPLRTTEDIDKAIRLVAEKGTEAVVSVTPSSQHPYLARRIDPAGILHNYIDSALSSARRQDLPPSFSLNGAIYLVRTESLFAQRSWCPPGATAYVMPEERSLDVDTEADLQVAEVRLSKRGRAAPPVARITIGSREVGAGCPCFIIAEAGVNHNGSVSLAKDLIDAAAGAGADAVKFQTFHAEDLVTPSAPKAVYQERSAVPGESQFAMLKKLELPEGAWPELRDHAAKKGLVFLSTPFDRRSASFLSTLNVPAFKLSSGEVTNHPFLRQVAEFQRPVILSTGMSSLQDVEEAVSEIRAAGNRQLILLHCVSNYPAMPEDANLRAMVMMGVRFGLPVGFSDHTPGSEAAMAAVALGACVVEKHLTLDRVLPGPDHQASLTPSDFALLVKNLRTVEAALGDGTKVARASEADTASVARRSLVAARTLRKGEVVNAADVEVKRPGTGLPPSRLADITGRQARVEIPVGTLFEMDMLE